MGQSKNIFLSVDWYANLLFGYLKSKSVFCLFCLGGRVFFNFFYELLYDLVSFFF